MGNHNLLGGKGSGLVWLAENKDLGFEVPEFMIIDISYQDEHQTKLEERCSELAEHFQGKKVAVRSSAVVSEDSDKHSGAGIYDTFFLDAGELDRRSLFDTVRRVYASVDSDRAIQYREQAGLENERMAVIVQEFVKGMNGVTMSRLPARSGIIPISFSRETGAAVGGQSKFPIHTMYLTEGNNGLDSIFESEGFPKELRTPMRTELGQLVQKIRERYGREFEAEFAFSLDLDGKLTDDNTIYMLQIRPLTNITNKTITFPDKESIFTAEICMSVGEYIGPWITTDKVRAGWNEPAHYAYVASSLERTMPNALGSGPGDLFGKQDNLDYDQLTPNKKAIILTGQATPGMHALTIANEKGLICLAAQCGQEESDEEFEREHGYSRFMAASMMGSSMINRPRFDVPLDQVGRYIHVVSDGLRGHVYRATEAEAREFEKNLLSQITYEVTPLTNDTPAESQWWDYTFTVKPSTVSAPYQDICRDFLRHLEQRSGKRFRLDVNPAQNSYVAHCAGAEFEVYCAHFSPDKREEGIWFSTGRSADQIAGAKDTFQRFQEFIDRVKSSGYNPTEAKAPDSL